jgi:hypothetical protein
MKKYTTAKACGKTLNKILANCNVLGRDKLVKIQQSIIYQIFELVNKIVKN